MIPSPPISSLPVGPLTLHLYGLILGISLLVTYQLAYKYGPKFGLPQKFVDLAFFLTIPLALIGARIYHVISNWDYYSSNPLQIPAIWNGGIGILGGIITGIAVLWFLAKKNQIPFLRITDFFAPLLALGQAIGRWGNYVNQELYGKPTELPWALYIDPQYRLKGYEQFTTFHPLFLYESVLNILNTVLLYMALVGKIKVQPTFLYLITYGLIRFNLEFLKIDPDTTNVFLGLKTAQYISLAMIFSGILLTIKYRRIR